MEIFSVDRPGLLGHLSFNAHTEGTFSLLLFDIACGKVGVSAWREERHVV